MKKATFPLLIISLSIFFLIASCATFEGEIPLGGSIPEEIYISPENQDGIQDTFVFALTIPDLKGLKIAGYNISVVSETDETVFTIREGKVMPEGENKIPGKKISVTIPNEITWDGTDNDGAWVSDGMYLMMITAWDFDGHNGALEPIRIFVDNTAPSSEINLPYLVFSPNNDGNQEELNLYQVSSSEDEWVGEFLDLSDKVVKTVKWTGLAQDFHWDGKDENKTSLDDGEYIYRLSSTDRAGNSFENLIQGIVIETKNYSISLTNNIRAFSPNGDGILDKVSFQLTADKADQISKFSFVIIDESGEIRRNFAPGVKQFPLNLEFDGRDNNNKYLPEGNYYGVFSVIYKNGNNPSVTSSAVKIDITPPTAVLSSNYRIFSPDGDGKKDEITISQSTSVEALWFGIITDSAGKTIRNFQWKDRAIAFKWDGKDNSGKISPDGEYGYALSSTDSAGTKGTYQSQKFILDTKPTPVTVQNKTSAFSPNGDGINDFMEFDLKPSVREGIISWNYKITDISGNDVFNFEQENNHDIPKTISWDGKNDSGIYVEGELLAALYVEYEKGNQVNARIESPFILDITPPEIKHSVDPIPFSPDGDGVNDQLKINAAVSDDRGVKNWSANILDPTGQVFFNIPSNQFKNGLFRWDGLSLNKELVQSASDYTLVIKAEDSVGNSITVKDTIPIDILVIKDGNNLKISISSINFKPFTADYLDLSPELKARNIITLDRLAVIMQKYFDYKIQLEGHAVRILWSDSKKWLREENETLLPLSSLRAESIRDALILRGIDGSRISTIGRGGYDPLVPHSDQINRWKNRRVEFILLK